MTTSAPTRGRPPGRTGRELLAEARAVFLDRGYAATTMDDVAARARISKSSLYREHPSKSALYAAVVSDWAASGRDAMRPSLERLEQNPVVERGLTEFAEILLGAILSPAVVEMRRLVINEAKSQPQVAATYLQESWNRNVAALAWTFDRLRERGSLNVDDTRAAAEDFTWLLVGGPLNAALLGVEPHPGADRPARAVSLFLARYGVRA
jgi:TetR/AcrR family transcriptional regulator, mexJK operon transcriptional repressor